MVNSASELSPFARQVVLPAARANPALFSLVYQDEAHNLHIFRVNRLP
jgi:hypothetical protein